MMDISSSTSARSGGSVEEHSMDWSNPSVANSCTPKVQELIILPTEQCNFRCTYCYEDFSIGSMPEAVQEGIERFLAVRVPELEQLRLSWFGGEPLAARKVVLRLADHAKRLCDEHGVQLSGALTTNAWHLDRELFDQLVRLDQNFFQITLDGWGSAHDLYRKKANGDGTFDRIWRNLLSFKGADGNYFVQIRVHVRRESWRDLDKLLSAIAASFGDDPRFGIDLEHIRNLGGEGGKSVNDPYSLTEFSQVHRELMALYRAKIREFHPEIAAQDESLASPELADVAGEGDFLGESGLPVCYASRANSLLIRADGRIGKCTVALTDARNTIGSINRDGSIDIDNQRLAPWIRGLRSLDTMELSCPLIGLPTFDEPVAQHV